jgi:C-terminal processing protease CtpA/Prc
MRPIGLESGSSISLDDVPCSVTGIVEDGFLTRRSAPAEVEPENGDVTLTFPDERTGGIGIRISTDEHGILIEDVLPGGPAEDLGLEPGDVVVAVEGKDAQEISLDEFVETMTGPEGSDVEFVLRVAGDTGDDALETVKVTRRFLGT